MSQMRSTLEDVLDGLRERLTELRGDTPLRSWLAQLKRKTGYNSSYVTVRRQETGESEISVRYVIAVALLTGCDPAWLIWEEGEPARRTEQLPADEAEKLADTVREMFRNPPAQRRRAGGDETGLE